MPTLTPPTAFGQQPPPPEGYSVAHFERQLDAMADRFASLRAAGDHRAVFHLTYLTFSRQVLEALRAGRFADAAWATDMCCRFVQAYAEQFDRWERRDPRLCEAWRIAFGASAAGRVNVLQAMFLGMNAHINYDLAFVTLGACRHAGDLPLDDTAERALRGSRGGVPVIRYRDFLLINQIAWESIPVIQDVVLRTFSRWLYWGNRSARRVTHALGQRVLLEARDASWCHTCLLIHADGVGHGEAVAAMIDAHAASIADAIGALTAHPLRFVAASRRWQRRWRRLHPDVEDGMVALSTSNPVVAELALHQLAFAGAAPVAVTQQLLRTDPRLAAVFATQVFRIAPSRRRRELRGFLVEGSDEAVAVVASLVDAGARRRELPPGTPVRHIRRTWRREAAEMRAFLAHPDVVGRPALAGAVAAVADTLETRLERLGAPRRPVRPPRRRPDPAALRTHPDPWVAACADAAFATLDPDRSTLVTALIERVLFLKDTAVFLEIEPAVLLHVAEHLEARRFAEGEELLRAGRPSGGIYLLRAGEVDVTQRREDRVVGVARLGPHDALGELSALNGTPATADCRARTTVEAYFLPANVLARLLHQHPRLGIGLLRTLSDRLAATTRQLSGED